MKKRSSTFVTEGKDKKVCDISVLDSLITLREKKKRVKHCSFQAAPANPTVISKYNCFDLVLSNYFVSIGLFMIRK